MDSTSLPMAAIHRLAQLGQSSNNAVVATDHKRQVVRRPTLDAEPVSPSCKLRLRNPVDVNLRHKYNISVDRAVPTPVDLTIEYCLKVAPVKRG